MQSPREIGDLLVRIAGDDFCVLRDVIVEQGIEGHTIKAISCGKAFVQHVRDLYNIRNYGTELNDFLERLQFGREYESNMWFDELKQSITCAHEFLREDDVNKDSFVCCDCNAEITDMRRCMKELRCRDDILYQDSLMSSENSSVYRGVTVWWLLEFTITHNLWGMPTWCVNRNIIQTKTSSGRCCFVDLIDEEGVVGRADYFISHAWASPFGDIVAALIDGSINLDARVWIDIFAVRQWPGNIADLNFPEVVTQCAKGMIIICSTLYKPYYDTLIKYGAAYLDYHIRSRIPFLRVWCLAEFYAAINNNHIIRINCGGYCFSNTDGTVSFKENRNLEKIFLEDLDICHAEAKFDYDKTRIMAEITEGLTIDEINCHLKDSIVGYGTSVKDAVRLESPEGFFLGAEIGDIKIMSASFIKYNMDVNMKDSKGFTALHHAAYRNNTDCVEYLMMMKDINLNCIVNRGCFSGYSPLMLAAKQDNCEVLSMLINQGCNLDLINDDGYSALMISASYGFTKTLRYLIQANANLEIADKHNGRTALLIAARQGYLNCVELLIIAGSDVHYTDRYGKTALSIAAEHTY
jgi:ankyrin repeat protein